MNHVFTLQGFFAEEKKIISPSKSVLRGAPEVVGILKILGPNLHGLQRGHVHLLPNKPLQVTGDQRGNPGGKTAPIPFVGSQAGHRCIVRTVWWNIYTTVVISGIKTWNWGAIYWQADVIHRNSELQTFVPWWGRPFVPNVFFGMCFRGLKKQIRDLQILLPVEMEFFGCEWYLAETAWRKLFDRFPLRVHRLGWWSAHLCCWIPCLATKISGWQTLSPSWRDNPNGQIYLITSLKKVAVANPFGILSMSQEGNLGDLTIFWGKHTQNKCERNHHLVLDSSGRRSHPTSCLPPFFRRPCGAGSSSVPGSFGTASLLSLEQPVKWPNSQRACK